MKKFTSYLLWVGILAALASSASAETRAISWDPVTTYTDSTTIGAGVTVTYTAYWTTDPGLGSLHTIGTSLATTSTTFDPGTQGMTRGTTVYFTAKAVLGTGEGSALSPAYAWAVPLVTPTSATLSGIAITGSSSVNEGATTTYTATATWSDASTTTVTPTWSENSTYATISTGGVLTASAVTSNQTVTVTATYTSGGVTKTATKSVTVADVPATLSGIAITGSSSVNEGATSTYTTTATWSDASTTTVTPTWSANLGSIGSSGLFTAPSVTSGQTATVTASYTSGGVTKTATKSVTIADVPATAPAAPKNIGITGPISSGASETWRLAWDPVTTYPNDALLEPGRTVSYTPYWTDDPALSAGSLRPLASSISGTALEFDPYVHQMAKNQLVYLTVRAILDTGNPSSLSDSRSWRVENKGPVPPKLGKIRKINK